MSEHAVLSTIKMVQQQVAELDQQLLEKKRMVNDLCKLAGRSPVYGDADLTSQSGSISRRPDEYYGKPQATVVRMILEKRHAAGLGAATVAEIYDEMVAGGYLFGGKNDDNNKRGLYISLGKNSATFHKLPNGTYGLLEWYPDVKVTRTKNGAANGMECKAEDAPLHEELQDDADSEDEARIARNTRAK